MLPPLYSHQCTMYVTTTVLTPVHYICYHHCTHAVTLLHVSAFQWPSSAVPIHSVSTVNSACPVSTLVKQHRAACYAAVCKQNKPAIVFCLNALMLNIYFRCAVPGVSCGICVSNAVLFKVAQIRVVFIRNF